MTALPRALASRTAALAMLGLLVPLLLPVVLGIRAASPGPMFFRQPRVGRNGRVFRMWKLRTMVPDAEHRLGHVLANDDAMRREWQAYGRLSRDPRIAGPAARFARRFSVDEVPQLLNVLSGDMALVGPRPVLPAQAEQMPAALRSLRESVRPGLTGLWQVNGRSNMTLRQMTRFDVLYVRRRSSMLDIWLMLCTPHAVLSARGAY
jgi:exopolysaccharide production protein ExoY